MTKNNIFGQHDLNTLEQFAAIEQRAVKAALMSDGHYGYIMPVGGVAAYENEVSVVGVGYDIGCGNCAIKTDMNINDLGKSAAKLQFMLSRFADEIQQTISFGVGRSNKADDAPTDHALFDAEDWNRIQERANHGEMRKIKDRARDQLGTVGSGNHYVDVFVDENGWIWVGVHFGSRGFGHGVASGFLSLAQGKLWGDRVPEQDTILSLYSSMGQDYWALMDLAGQYAYAGREWVTRKVVEILGAHEVEMVHNHHNFAWKEELSVAVAREPSNEPLENFEQRKLIVVRKGATPAYPGQKGFVGGSMGDISVILQGRDAVVDEYNEVLPEGQTAWDITLNQIYALYSTVHGAGRVMSRTEAAGKRNRKTGKLVLDGNGDPKRPPKVTEEMMKEWIKRENVIVRGGGVDESPHVYRRLPKVLDSQRGTVKVLHTLQPVIVVMAGGNEFDPYKD